MVWVIALVMFIAMLYGREFTAAAILVAGALVAETLDNFKDNLCQRFPVTDENRMVAEWRRKAGQ